MTAMNKTAAIRSQARMAALVKHAGVLDRLAAIGARYKELLAGNSPLMGNYKWGKRYVDALASGEAGVSPAAEKIKYVWQILTSNSPVGSELRKVYATRAGTGVAGIAGLKALLGGSGEKKSAEARPTPEEQAFAAGFCKAAEAMGVDPGALYKEAALSRKGALRWVMSLGKVTPRTKAPQITGIIDRLQGVGRLPSPVAENLSHMRNLATAVDKYTAARGATTNWLGMPTFPEATLAKGRKFIPQLIEDASRLNSGGAMSAGEIDVSSAAKNILKMIGYMK